MRLWKEKTILILACLALSVYLVLPLHAATITDDDSTQPRGAPVPEPPFNVNDWGQDLRPMIDGFVSPHQRRALILGGFLAGFVPEPVWLKFADDYYDWSGMIMANSARDPAFYAMLSVVNKTFIRYVNAHSGDPSDPDSEVHRVLKDLGLEDVITHRDKRGRLQPEEQIPIVADFCLRCHTPVGWLEGRSEPANVDAPHLRGQFWGAALKAYPGDPGSPQIFDPKRDSESDIDGIQCDVCHRMTDNSKTLSLFDGLDIPAGSAGYFFEREQDPVFILRDFALKSEMCGTCHNITNPVFKTKTVVNGEIPDMLHPIERTFTEWQFSDYGPGGDKETECQGCHKPMKFFGAQTWLIDPGLGDLWGDMDEVWTQPPFNYPVPVNRTSPVFNPRCGDPEDPSCYRDGAYVDAAARNREFMKTAATIEFIEMPEQVAAREKMVATVRVTNLTGHKLPTGFPEGRRMWIDLKVKDQRTGRIIFHSGKLRKGKLVEPKQAKVYEVVNIAEGYDDLMFQGFNILDLNKNGRVTHKEKEFHFVLGNKVEKDNRIPPAGFNKAAYLADGAFIIPRDSLDNDYADGQNWDDTQYRVHIPRWVKGPLEITATLKYQTFSGEFMKFLKKEDVEKTQKYGGRARNIPTTGKFGHYRRWGKVIHAIWKKNDHGRPVEMATAKHTVPVD